MVRNRRFTSAPEVSRHAADPYPPGTQNPSKNVLKKGCSKRRSKSALWSPMGRPRDPLGAQMTPKWDPKGSPKGSKNSVFSHSDEKLQNTTKLQYLLCFVHFSHLRKRRFFMFFWLPNGCRNGEAIKYAPRALCKTLWGAPERAQCRKWAPTGSQEGSQEELKMTSKSSF